MTAIMTMTIIETAIITTAMMTINGARHRLGLDQDGHRLLTMMMIMNHRERGSLKAHQEDHHLRVVGAQERLGLLL
jgi:hypothetical protein